MAQLPAGRLLRLGTKWDAERCNEQVPDAEPYTEIDLDIRYSKDIYPHVYLHNYRYMFIDVCM